MVRRSTDHADHPQHVQREEMMEVRVTRQDIVGMYCLKGARAFYARHGLDYEEFRRVGTPASVLLATGDMMASRAVEMAEKRCGR